MKEFKSDGTSYVLGDTARVNFKGYLPQNITGKTTMLDMMRHSAENMQHDTVTFTHQTNALSTIPGDAVYLRTEDGNYIYGFVQKAPPLSDAEVMGMFSGVFK